MFVFAFIIQYNGVLRIGQIQELKGHASGK